MNLYALEGRVFCMARTNQGVFKKILDENRRLDKEYKNVIVKYQADSSSIDFFSELAYISDYLYNDLGKLASDVHGMLLSTKMENSDTEKTYRTIESSALERQNEIKQMFRHRLEEIKIGGGFLTEAEQETIDKLSIK